MAKITTIAALYLWKSHIDREIKRRHVWINNNQLADRTVAFSNVLLPSPGRKLYVWISATSSAT